MHCKLITYLFRDKGFESSRTFKISSFTKLPVRSPVKYTILRIQSPDHNVYEIKMASEDGTGSYVTDTDPGVAAASLDDSLQLHTAFSCFPRLKRRRRRSRPGVAVAEKDGTMPGEMKFVISGTALRTQATLKSLTLLTLRSWNRWNPTSHCTQSAPTRTTQLRIASPNQQFYPL